MSNDSMPSLLFLHAYHGWKDEIEDWFPGPKSVFSLEIATKKILHESTYT